jgi:hypothetical protein
MDLTEPGVIAPGPDNGTHNVGKDKGIKKFGKNKDLHVGERKSRGIFLQCGGIRKIRFERHCKNQD